MSIAGNQVEGWEDASMAETVTPRGEERGEWCESGGITSVCVQQVLLEAAALMSIPLWGGHCSASCTVLNSLQPSQVRWDPENLQRLDGFRANDEIQLLRGSVDPVGGSRGRVTFRSKVLAQENMQWVSSLPMGRARGMGCLSLGPHCRAVTEW